MSIDEEEVERIARVIWATAWERGCKTVAEMSWQEDREHWRKAARAVLEALPTPTADAGAELRGLHSEAQNMVRAVRAAARAGIRGISGLVKQADHLEAANVRAQAPARTAPPEAEACAGERNRPGSCPKCGGTAMAMVMCDDSECPVPNIWSAPAAPAPDTREKMIPASAVREAARRRYTNEPWQSIDAPDAETWLQAADELLPATPPEAEACAGELAVGDYVLATKYDDGDPQDHWCCGFFKGTTGHEPPRFDVVDGNGHLFRGNGFRRCERITADEGGSLLKQAWPAGMPIWKRLASLRVALDAGEEG